MDHRFFSLGSDLFFHHVETAFRSHQRMINDMMRSFDNRNPAYAGNRSPNHTHINRSPNKQVGTGLQAFATVRTKPNGSSFVLTDDMYDYDDCVRHHGTNQFKGPGRQFTLSREGIVATQTSPRMNRDYPRTDSSTSLGIGWWRLSANGSGSLKQCGAHTLIESAFSKRFVCAYEPKSRELKNAIGYQVHSAGDSLLRHIPCFELEFDIKITAGPSVQCSVLMGLRSLLDHSRDNEVLCDCIELVIDLDHRSSHLVFSNKQKSTGEPISRSKLDTSLKPNIFFHVHLTVEIDHIVVKINDRIIHNVDIAARPMNGSSSITNDADSRLLGGLVGFSCKNSVVAFKNWKLTKGKALETFMLTNTPSTTTSTRVAPTTISSVPEVSTSIAVASNPAKEITSMALAGDKQMATKIDAAVVKSSQRTVMDRHLGFSDEFQSNIQLKLSQRYGQDLNSVIISTVIAPDSLKTTFDDLAAMEQAKSVLKEAVVLPLILPELFVGLREPWKGVLLFGPPGTGKTLLAKAIAGMNKCTFFNCSSATLTSKWRGDSEKLVKCLFESAAMCSPSIIFLDEIDGLLTARGEEGEHESSRRVKTEFFSQMDGIHSAIQQRVMVLATTNCPWDLDTAVLRRFEKRIYIPLPEIDAREEQFRKALNKIQCAPDISVHKLAEKTAGFSCADITTVCKEASMAPMRRLLASMSIDQIERMRSKGNLVVSQVTSDDFDAAIANSNPSVPQSVLSRYVQWQQQFATNA